jgi:hypothetical protein
VEDTDEEEEEEEEDEEEEKEEEEDIFVFNVPDEAIETEGSKWA